MIYYLSAPRSLFSVAVQRLLRLFRIPAHVTKDDLEELKTY